jgi:hypothetical protein
VRPSPPQAKVWHGLLAFAMTGRAAPNRALWSPVAQLVEQAAVNRWVAGSSPARGAILNKSLSGNSFHQVRASSATDVRHVYGRPAWRRRFSLCKPNGMNTPPKRRRYRTPKRLSGPLGEGCCAALEFASEDVPKGTRFRVPFFCNLDLLIMLGALLLGLPG